MANFFDRFRQQTSSKKVLPVILVTDASDSMSGERMLCVNRAIRALIGRFADYNRIARNEYRIKIAILKFASGSQWVTEGLMDPAKFAPPVISCSGASDFGSALLELNHKLSGNAFFSGSSSFASPMICFVSKGMPTDNYATALAQLNKNTWYKSAKKAAIAIGDAVDFVALGRVVGTPDAVIHLNSAVFLEQIMIGVAASFVGLPDQITPPAPPISSQFGQSFPGTEEFDSDVVCATCALEGEAPNAFDSDAVCATCALEGETYTAFDSERYSSWSGSDREASGWGGPVMPPVSPAFENPAVGGGQCASFMPSMPLPDRKLPVGEIRCKKCNHLILPGLKFCPYCGASVSMDVPQKVNVTQVQFSAVVPKRLMKGEYGMIEIAVYEEMYRHIVDRIIANADDEVREVVASSQKVADKTKIRIVLSSPDIEVSDCEEVQEWHGKYLTFSFPIEVPGDYAKKQILFVAAVYFNDLIATKLKFIANSASAKEQKLQMTREDILTAFISYASQDRSRVATIIQGMQKARPDMDIFFDVESLRSGEDWELALRREIERRDILFLCWSNFAKQSEWVEKEWRYALASKGADAIEPIPLVSPAECPPPEELKAKHFNDRALLYK